jgi:hypothetical protein
MYTCLATVSILWPLLYVIIYKVKLKTPTLRWLISPVQALVYSKPISVLRLFASATYYVHMYDGCAYQQYCLFAVKRCACFCVTLSVFILRTIVYYRYMIYGKSKLHQKKNYSVKFSAIKRNIKATSRYDLYAGILGVTWYHTSSCIDYRRFVFSS